MGRVSDEEIALLAEGEVLGILKLAFSDTGRADIEQVLEFQLFGDRFRRGQDEPHAQHSNALVL